LTYILVRLVQSLPIFQQEAKSNSSIARNSQWLSEESLVPFFSSEKNRSRHWNCELFSVSFYRSQAHSFVCLPANACAQHAYAHAHVAATVATLHPRHCATGASCTPRGARGSPSFLLSCSLLRLLGSWHACEPSTAYSTYRPLAFFSSSSASSWFFFKKNPRSSRFRVHASIEIPARPFSLIVCLQLSSLLIDRWNRRVI